MRRSAVGAALVLGMSVVPLAGTAWAAEPCSAPDSNRVVTCSYGFTGGEQTFTVPSGVTQVQVISVGGAGGNSADDNSIPSRGARASGTVTGLVAGRVLYVEVGGAATGGGTCVGPARCAGGFNGGGSNPRTAGGGGGASDVRSLSRDLAGSLETRLVVAAGGGGAGGPVDNCPAARLLGGGGGDAGAAGGAGQVCPFKGVTGASTGGGAGTDTEGGAGGTTTVDGSVRSTGTNGASGTGAGTSTLGGAGGGGHFGGGSGATAAFIPETAEDAVAAGGGGGGSSLVPTGGTVSVTGGPASVTILYTAPVDGTASAQLTALGTAVQGVGPGKSLANKVTTAQSRLATGDTAGACGALTGFVNEVTAQSGKKIPTATAGQLLADASRIRAVIGC